MHPHHVSAPVWSSIGNARPDDAFYRSLRGDGPHHPARQLRHQSRQTRRLTRGHLLVLGAQSGGLPESHRARTQRALRSRPGRFSLRRRARFCVISWRHLLQSAFQPPGLCVAYRVRIRRVRHRGWRSGRSSRQCHHGLVHRKSAILRGGARRHSAPVMPAATITN